jgi:hypothetical protein
MGGHMGRALIALAMSLALAGCGTYLGDAYTTSNPASWSARPAPSVPPVAPRLLSSDDMVTDLLHEYEDGYIEIGRSAYSGPTPREKTLRTQAIVVGAERVLVYVRFRNASITTTSTTHYTSVPVYVPPMMGSGISTGHTEMRQQSYTTTSPQTVNVYEVG